MKKMIKLFLCTLSFTPLIINARIDYDDAVEYANNYIYNFKEYKDYIYLDKNIPYSFENNKNIVDSKFNSGGFLSRGEYEISNVKKNSYLSNGLQYWTLTKSSHMKHYIIDYKLVEQLDTNLSGVRITEYTKSDVVVSGKGTYSNPWIFDELLSIHINSDNTYRGKVSTVECSDLSMRKESIHLNVVSEKARPFYICPESGYKFLKSTCSQYITNQNMNNMYTVEDLDRDNVICKVSFSYVTKPIEVKGCTTCNTGKNDRTFYVNNTHKIWLQDLDGTQKIETIDNLPTKTGYTFKGYYTSNENFIDTNKVIESNGNLIYNEQLTSNDTLYPYMKPNEYIVKYNCNGGSGSTEQSSHVYDEEKVLTSNGCTRKGYKFEGWSTTSSGSKEYNNGDTVKNLTSVNGETVTLYAVWSKCQAGTYGENGTTCVQCPVGTYNSKTASTSIDACQKCAAGTYNNKKGSTSSSACILCASGTYSNAGASNCTKCSAGYYASGTGNTKCTICSSGTYASSTGSAACTQCSTGTYNSNTGSTSSSDCVSCPSGYTSNKGATSNTNCYRTLYRTRTCYTAARCSAAGCYERNSCVHSSCGSTTTTKVVSKGGSSCSTYNGTNRGGYILSNCYPGPDELNDCTCTGSQTKSCPNSTCSCKTYYRNESLCGCSTWNSWGAWTTSYCDSSSNKCESNIFYYPY